MYQELGFTSSPPSFSSKNSSVSICIPHFKNVQNTREDDNFRTISKKRVFRHIFVVKNDITTAAPFLSLFLSLLYNIIVLYIFHIFQCKRITLVFFSLSPFLSLLLKNSLDVSLLLSLSLFRTKNRVFCMMCELSFLCLLEFVAGGEPFCSTIFF